MCRYVKIHAPIRIAYISDDDDNDDDDDDDDDRSICDHPGTARLSGNDGSVIRDLLSFETEPRHYPPLNNIPKPVSPTTDDLFATRILDGGFRASPSKGLRRVIPTCYVRTNARA